MFVSAPPGEPPAEGVAHVASPRQNVVLEALVPELRFATGRLPVTALLLARFTAPKASAVPDRRSTWLSLAAAMLAKSAVALPVTPSTDNAEPCVRFANGKSPLIPFARFIWLHAGLLLVPVFDT